MTDEPKVEQVDREAAAEWLGYVTYSSSESDQFEIDELAQAFARHREAAVLREREACAAFLLEHSDGEMSWAHRMAEAIRSRSEGAT